MSGKTKPRVLLTGATGYVGARLGKRLLDAGYPLRCVVRSKRKLLGRPWANDPRVQIVEVSIDDTDALADVMAGCGPAYYLIHSMEAAGETYADRDRRLAESFVRAAEQADLTRIVYLGGLGELGDGLSEHLTSRREIEHVLRDGGIPITVFRAAMIIGSGSASLEILRYLVERLPIMLTPRWVSTESQPIAIRNVLGYLVDCLDAPDTAGQTLDIGGPDVMSYRDLMHEMAAALGLSRRWIIPVPVLTPRLSSGWIHLVTPLSYRIARPLADGLRNRMVCRDDRAQRLMPQRLLGVHESIEAALGKERAMEMESSWSDAGPIPGDPDWAGGTLFTDEKNEVVHASADACFAAITKVGGGHGYYWGDWLWRLRGALDRMVGGPGLRRGRRHPSELAYGDALDFWRVTQIEKPHRLQLRAEMKLPGIATLEFEVNPDTKTGGHAITQTARFKPRGLFGLAYWYAVLPLHGFVFRGMLRGIKDEAESSV